MSNEKAHIFSERLKMRRESMGYTQEKFAAALGMSKGAVGNWERGSHIPAAPERRKIAELLRTSQGWLLGETDEVESPGSCIELKLSERFRGELEGYAKIADQDVVAFIIGVIERHAKADAEKKAIDRIQQGSVPISSAVKSALEHEELPPLDEGPNRPPKS